MIELVTIATGVGMGVVGCGIGILIGRRAEARRAAIALEDHRIDAERAATNHRRDVDALSRALDELRGRAAISLAGSLPQDAPPSRPTARALERYPARLRGLATVDDAVVVQADGLIATQADDPAFARAATLVADLGPLFDMQLPGFVGLTVERRGFDPLTYRLLPDWTRGAWLVVGGRGGPVNGLALDTAIAGAFVNQNHVPPSQMLTGHAPATESDGADVILDSNGAFQAAAVIGVDGLLAYGTLGGPPRALMSGMVPGLRILAERVHHWCGAPLTLRLDNAHGEWLLWTPIDDERSLVVIGAGPSVDELALERLRGRVRRITTTSAATAEGIEERAS